MLTACSLVPTGSPPYPWILLYPTYAMPLTNSIIISAPHSQRAYRYSESDNTHSRDLYTGAYAQILSDLTGMPTIIAKYKTDDPNYYDYIPSETSIVTLIGNVLFNTGIIESVFSTISYEALSFKKFIVYSRLSVSTS